MERSDYIYGIRAVIEAIEAGKEIDKIFIAKDLQGELAGELISAARKAHVVMQRVPVERINRITRKNHQGVLAMMSAVTYHRLDHCSVSVGGDAIKTSAGALHHIPVCRVSSIAWAAKFLRENGYNVVAVSEKADINYTEGKYSDPVALVMGAEDVGISPEAMKQCETRVAIPMFGNIGSLNVSVAAGVMIYEVVRQRLKANLEII